MNRDEFYSLQDIKTIIEMVSDERSKYLEWHEEDVMKRFIEDLIAEFESRQKLADLRKLM